MEHSLFKSLYPGLTLPVVLILCGCGTTGFQEATLGPAVEQFSVVPPKAGSGTLYVGRPFTMNTSVFAVEVELDGRPLATMGPGQFTRIDLRPGPHSLAIRNSYWNNVISGIPHPADFQVEGGKIYYALPTTFAGETRTSFTMINGMAIPEQSAVAQGGFVVQASTSSAPPPSAFNGLKSVPPSQ